MIQGAQAVNGSGGLLNPTAAGMTMTGMHGLEGGGGETERCAADSCSFGSLPSARDGRPLSRCPPFASCMLCVNKSSHRTVRAEVGPVGYNMMEGKRRVEGGVKVARM